MYLGSLFKERNKQKKGKSIQSIICYHHSIRIQRGIKRGFLQLNRQCSWAASWPQVLTALHKTIQRVINRQDRRYRQPTASLGCKVRERGNIQFKDTTKVLDKSIKLQNNLTFSWQKSSGISQHNCEAGEQQYALGYQPLPGLLASLPMGTLWALSAAPCLVPALCLCRSKAKAEWEAVCKANSQPPPAPFHDRTFWHRFGIMTASFISHLISISPWLHESCPSLWTCEKDLLPGGEKPHSIY